MRSRIILFVCTLLCLAGTSNAQNRCATDEVYQRLKKEHPEIEIYEQQLAQQLDNDMKDGTLNKFAKTTGTPDTVTYDIPLVVHVVHDYGVEYLTDNTIVNAVNYWAQVYVEQNADTTDVILPFKKYVGNPRIRLHLATIDPNGKPTKGIVHTHTYLTYNASDESKMNGWPNTSYVNVWFINTFGGQSTGAAAYAYYPSAGAAMPYYDGVIGLYDYVNYDKAIPHEIGHVLNLEHPWGNTNQPGVACGDDGVDDTPPTMGHEPVGCVASALYDTTCASHYHKVYLTSTGSDSTVYYPDTVNSQNIMDYTYCQKMFTIGQVYRMRQALTSTVASRNNLYSPANLAATGALAPYPDLPPIADFSVEKGFGGGLVAERSYFLCANDATKFVFDNRSWNDTVSGVQWSFSNGASIPTSTSIGLVETRFSQPGWVTVTLIATSNAGSDTLVRNQAVYVADTNALQPGGYTETFSNPSDTGSWPMFNYYGNQFKWGWYSGAGYGDNSCIRYRSYDNRPFPVNQTGTPAGDHDDIVTPAFDLSANTTGDLNLNFYTAAADRSGTSNSQDDTMEVWVSSTCGTTWTQIATLAPSQILNNAARSLEFVPNTTSAWKPQTIAIPAAYRSGKTFFRFRYLPGTKGNDLYLDNFSISAYPTEVNEAVATPNTFKVYPNPTNNGCNVIFKSGADGRVAFDIKDVTGKTVYQKEEIYQPNTIVQQPLQHSIIPNAGIYFITVNINNVTTTQKLVVY